MQLKNNTNDSTRTEGISLIFLGEKTNGWRYVSMLVHAFSNERKGEIHTSSKMEYSLLVLTQKYTKFNKKLQFNLGTNVQKAN